ncbi:MAG: hypothetical protein M3Y33_19245, partial [Actinomycetota bacterium]|nr:hypothetical protein [Actinomycetota bacterium]
MRARPGRSEHEEVITLISGPESFFPDLPATYVGETAGGQRCAVDPAGITEILGTAHPATHSEMPPAAEAGHEAVQEKAVLSGAPQDHGAGSTGNPAAAPGSSAPADPADSPAAAIWQAPREAARLAAAEGCTYHLYRATGRAGIAHCVITAVPPRTAAGYLSVTPAGTWTETWRGQDRPLDPGAAPGPDYPITLSEARALAAAARLEVHITRAAGRAFVSLAEPGAASAPALSFEYGSREVFAGRHITTASQAIAWLDTCRAAADEWAAAHGGDIFTAAGSSPGWTCRIAHLIPHLPAGPDHERAVAEHLTAAIRLARRSQPAEAEQALRRAEAASPALVLAPAREAALTEKIESDAARYAWTGTPGRYIAEVMQATPPEWEWIDRRIAAGSYTQAPASARQPGPAAATAKDSTAAARDLAGQARAAYDQGHHGQALALVDDAEICDPVQQHRYDQIRQVIITSAAAAPPATSIPGDSASGPAGAQPVPAESQVQATAAQSLPGQPVPELSELPPEPAAPPRESADSWSLKSMKGYMAAHDSLMAWRLAEEAGRLQRAGASHQDVMMALAGAESVAPEAGRPFHAARLDAYAAAHGLRGWYRGTGRDRDGRDGQPVVHVNRIRTAADGDRGRYFYHGHSAVSGPDYAVVDRDTGQRAALFATRQEADAWIEHAEERAGPVTGADAARAIPPSAAGDEAAATEGNETGAMTTPAAPAAPVTPPMTGQAGPPDGTQPVTAHTEWGGPQRPERLLYADGTPLTVRGQGEDGDQAWQATAA